MKIYKPASLLIAVLLVMCMFTGIILVDMFLTFQPIAAYTTFIKAIICGVLGLMVVIFIIDAFSWEMDRYYLDNEGFCSLGDRCKCGGGCKSCVFAQEAFRAGIKDK